MVNVKRLVLVSVFVSFAIILSYMERLIPTPFLVAGAKLGLSNIITVVTLVVMSKKESFLILIVRIIFASILFSGFSGFLYSFAGGTLSYLGMVLVLSLNIKDLSLVGVSVLGAVLHSLGQVIVAVALFDNLVIFSYLPILLITSVITGIFVGMTSNLLVKRLIDANVIWKNYEAIRWFLYLIGVIFFLVLL